ncbi:hypothetical protein EDF42_1460 [Curtobacterium sp. PhB172]|nr:hypothetical protein EDF42_1460 [Curtobacterium sp. PhB172]
MRACEHVCVRAGTVRVSSAGAGRARRGAWRARCGFRRLVRCWPRGACLLRCTVRGSGHGVAWSARCGREARCGAVTGLPSAGGYAGWARCGFRRLVRGRPRGASLLRRTVRGSGHGVAWSARCGREARCGAATGLPSAGAYAGRARCGFRRLRRCWPRGAPLLRCTVRGSGHGVAWSARCGREARCGAVTGRASPRVRAIRARAAPAGTVRSGSRRTPRPERGCRWRRRGRRPRRRRAPCR